MASSSFLSRHFPALALVGWAVSSVLSADLPPAATRSISFQSDIGPILTTSCQGCHGPKRAESGLRLDSRGALLQGGDRGPAVEPGQSARSLLIQAIAGAHADIPRMPRKGELLSAEQIGLLRAWIDQGAVWLADAAAGAAANALHWAFRIPARPPLPQVSNRQWAANPIDRFILARLEREGLKPSPQASRTALLRRVSLDLAGLPPSIDEVDGFLADKSAEAYRRQAERLLKSPHYGERWGRHWLDGARYADSDGFEKDKQRSVWFYRDWVVNAFNRDLPYNQFIIEQIAGDLLPGATQDQVVATGFLRNSMLNEEGGIDPEQFRMEAMFDRMDAIGKSMLGLTIQCSQCHNHKYDPLTQAGYYQLFAFLNNSHEANIVVYTPDQLMKRAELLRQIREIEENVKHRSPSWQNDLAAWENSIREPMEIWKPMPLGNSGDNGQRYTEQSDGSLLAGGYAPTKFTATFTNTVHDPEIRAFRLELLTDPNLPANGPGRSVKGLFGLTEFKVDAEDPHNPTNKIQVKFTSAHADFGNEELPLELVFDDRSGKRRVTGPISYAIDDKDETAWGIDAGPGRRNTDRAAIFVASTNVAFPNGTKLTFHLRQMHGGWNSDDNQNMNLGRFRIFISSHSAAAAPLPRSLRETLAMAPERRTPAQSAAVFSRWRATASNWAEANARIESLWKQHPEGSTQLVLDERPSEMARPTHLLRRGDWLKPGQSIQPGTPAFLHPLPPNSESVPSRLRFARWLADRDSPTTARSIVNRMWQHYFGTGLIETSEDLGKQSPPPSHPELLDWLAVELMENQWSLKHIHRLIVLSNTYKQSSRIDPALYAKDQFNRLLARGPRARVEAEIVRDISLAASGLLNPALGGASVYPPAPAFLFAPPASYGPKIWKEDSGKDRYRRSLYTFRYRSVPYPVLQNFDAPNGDFACVRRVRSNTPLQALTSLNEDLFMESARALALRTLQEGGRTDRERVTYAFRRCLSRHPTRAEAAELLGLLQRQAAHIQQGWIDAKVLGGITADTNTNTNTNSTSPSTTISPVTIPMGTTPTQLAAWTAVSRVLLNLDETITKE